MLDRLCAILEQSCEVRHCFIPHLSINGFVDESFSNLEICKMLGILLVHRVSWINLVGFGQVNTCFIQLPQSNIALADSIICFSKLRINIECQFAVVHCCVEIINFQICDGTICIVCRISSITLNCFPI